MLHSKHAIVSVIHVHNPTRALLDAQTARDAGTDGVLLSSRELSDAALLDIHAAIAERFPGWFVGHVAALADDIEATTAALASSARTVVGGITLDNVHTHLPHAGCLLLAAGLEPNHVARLVAEVRAHDGQSRRLMRPSPRWAAQVDPLVRHPVVLTDFTRGPVFEIDLRWFPEPEPVFAYCDDDGSVVDQLEGLEHAGTLELERDHTTRRCRLLRATRDAGPLVRLRSRGVGEFWLEIHHVPPDGAPRLLWRDDFCLK